MFEHLSPLRRQQRTFRMQTGAGLRLSVRSSALTFQAGAGEHKIRLYNWMRFKTKSGVNSASFLRAIKYLDTPLSPTRLFAYAYACFWLRFVTNARYQPCSF